MREDLEDAELDDPGRRLLEEQESPREGPGSSALPLGRLRGAGADLDQPGSASLNSFSTAASQSQSQSRHGDSSPSSSSAHRPSALLPGLEDERTGRAHAPGQSEAQGEGEIIDTLGKEIAAIVAPVTICMSLVVCLVLLLTPDGSADGSIVPVVGALVYQEKSSDSSAQKFEGGLLNAAAFVVIVAIMTFGLVGLFYLRCTKCLWGYMGLSGLTILGCLGGFVAVQVIEVLSIPIDVITFGVALYNVSVVGVLAVFFCRMPIFLTQCYLVLIAAVVAFWFTHLPEWTTWLMLVAMALYDLLAVLAPGGPLKLLIELAMERGEDLPALIYEARPPPPILITSTEPPLPASMAPPHSLPRTRPGNTSAPAGSLTALQPADRQGGSRQRATSAAASASASPSSSAATSRPGATPANATATATARGTSTGIDAAGCRPLEPSAREVCVVDVGNEWAEGTGAGTGADARSSQGGVPGAGTGAGPSTGPGAASRQLVGRFQRRAGAPAPLAWGGDIVPSLPSPAGMAKKSKGKTPTVGTESTEDEAGVGQGLSRLLDSQRSKSWQGAGARGEDTVQDSDSGALLTAESESGSGSRSGGGTQVRNPSAAQPMGRLQVAVPVDEGTSVVVPRQRSPVRRNVARRSIGPLDPQSQSHSPSQSQPPSQPQPRPQTQAQARSEVHPARQSQTQSLPAAVLSEQVEEARGLRLFSPQAVRSTPQDSETVRLTVHDSTVEDSRAGPDTNSSSRQEPLSGGRGVAGAEHEANEMEFALPGAIKLGLGDFIFYSIMVGRAAMYDMMTVYACYLAIIAGLGATLVLLAVTRRALPALPFSICLGVLFYLLTRVLLEPFVVTMVTSLLYF